MPDTIARLNRALRGRYRVERPLGEGGMATVYLAADLRHGRKVALKVLKAELAAVVGGERFLAEISTTANLQHPHILPLHDSGEADGLLFYVMPYVDGEGLRDRLERERQLPVEEAISIVAGVASALQAAHAQGIVHRDIKPANILLSNGEPLVADFGIALAVGMANGGRLTETGLSVGTPNYMSPEQATGEGPIGPGTDVWALGCVLYEMLAGEPPYRGRTVQAVLGKIVLGTPDPVRVHRPSVPPHVEAAIARALEKIPADRFKDAGDFARALSDSSYRHVTQGAVERVGAAGGRWKTSVAAAVGISLVIAAFAWSGVSFAPRPREDAVRMGVILPVGQEPSIRFWEPPLTVSADGTLLAYAAFGDGVSRLYVRPLGELGPRALPGTEGAETPAFSPDGRWLAYFATGRLWRVSLDGGPPLPLCEADRVRFGAAWGDDGYIYFGDDRGLSRVSADGGTPQVVSPIDPEAGEFSRGLPQVLPDGRILVTVRGSVDGRAEVRAEIVNATEGESRVVLDNASGARYVDGGYLVFGRAGVTQVAAFDLRRSRVTSPSVPLPDDVQMSIGGNPLFSSSDDVLVYLPSGARLRVAGGSAAPSALVRVAWDGSETTLWEEWPGQGSVSLSRDGRRVVDFVATDPSDLGGDNFQISEFDLDRHASTRLTAGVTSLYPIYAPDGRRVVFSATVDGAASIYRVEPGGDPEPLSDDDEEQFASSWSPDGGLLAFYQRGLTTGFDIWLLPMESDGEARPFLQTPANETALMFSPDGRWVAYVSDLSGQQEVYVRPFTGTGERALASRDGGRSPRWSLDGSELYYRQGDGFWSVTVRTAPRLEVGAPRLLFRGPFGVGYALDPEGRGVVTTRRDTTPARSHFNVVLSWSRELERLVGS